MMAAGALPRPAALTGWGSRGSLVADAFPAALALEAGCALVATDSHYSRFPGLRWATPPT